VHGFLSHLHSLMVTMSQKSSVPQAVKSVSQTLIRTTAAARKGRARVAGRVVGWQSPSTGAAIAAGRPALGPVDNARGWRSWERSVEDVPAAVEGALIAALLRAADTAAVLRLRRDRLEALAITEQVAPSLFLQIMQGSVSNIPPTITHYFSINTA
jgi:hypothetical protein